MNTEDQTDTNNTITTRENYNAAGHYPVAKSVKQVVGYPRIDNRLASITIKDLLRQNPELEAGLLRTPDIDAELQPFFTGRSKG
ncbi:hypothetical protein BDB00DRAFT_874470 [Zychaea mexicana]|uniref:uncharacterized protein n=1 Tax=Zychaea mexicana TaxID=64656 RepID=UPI0022FDC107|nr:uncharacterized protein BDB00DRAFT_874470 [Zychaea mexicana]KAI9491239.1 hypothetical protein BDB00DRAFT_874470 [Zychaea mexicana]